MEGRYAVPFHFAAEFLVLVVAVGACLDALRARKYGAGVWALAQSFAFALLAVAQALHGSLVLQPDGHQIVEVLRGASFIILAMAARPAASVLPSAALAAGAVPALFAPGVDANYAIVPAVAAVAVAARGIAAHRRDQDPATFAFAGAFLAFAAAEAAVLVAPANGGGLIILSHAARAIGALFLARWLWSSVVRSVRMRTVAAFVIVLTVGVLVVSAVLNLVIGDTLQSEDFKRLGDAGRARLSGISSLTEAASATAASVTQDSRLTTAVAKREKPSAYFPLVGLLPSNADFLLVIDGKGKVIGSAENVATPHRLLRAEEVSIAGSPVISEVLRGRSTSASAVPLSFETTQGERSEIVVLGSAAVRGRGGRGITAVVVVGYRLDRSYLLVVADDTGIDIRAQASGPPGGGLGLLVGEPLRVTATTFDVANDAYLRAVLPAATRARETRHVIEQLVQIGGQPYTTAFVPVTDAAANNTIGVLILSRFTSGLVDAQRSLTRTLFFVTLLAVAIAALLAWLSGGRVTRPIRSLTAAARELSAGNLEARARVASVDEVGSLGNAFNEMAVELQRTTSGLRDAATAEATLRARMEAIVQSMGDALIATDAEGRIVTFNRAAERMLARRVDRAQGRKIADVLDGTAEGGRALADAAMHVAATSGALRVSGRPVLTVALTAAPLLDDAGKSTGRVIVLRDVTREQEAERMKSEFLANVSHELRTPITPIKGYAEIMSRKDFPREKAMQFLEGILDSTERLERIVEILVDFAAIEAGRLKPKQDAVPVKALIDASISKWRAKDTAHRFVRHGGADLPPALGDARLLGRALDELIDNAVKFTPTGGKIEIFAEPVGNGRARRPSKVTITVLDDGPGIEEDRIPELFRDFRQLDGSETRAFGGLGLGLAYVKRILNVHGGEVLVESEPGKGSAFTLVLPVASESKTVVKPRPRTGARAVKRSR